MDLTSLTIEELDDLCRKYNKERDMRQNYKVIRHGKKARFVKLCIIRALSEGNVKKAIFYCKDCYPPMTDREAKALIKFILEHPDQWKGQ